MAREQVVTLFASGIDTHRSPKNIFKIIKIRINMFYFVYKTTNDVNGKFYIGAHQTLDLNDGYLGSGKYLNNAINKYGREHFSKKILNYFESAEDMYGHEKSLITQDLIESDDCYNLVEGGTGGSIIKNRKPFYGPHTEETKIKISKKNFGRIHSAQSRANMSNNSWARIDPEVQRIHARYAAKMSWLNKRSSWTNSEFSFKRREKISESLKKYFATHDHCAKGKPKTKINCPHCFKNVAINTAKRWHFDNCKLVNDRDNSKFSNYWIYNSELDKHKRVRIDELDFWISNGWIKGRKMK